jgi:tRNA(Ile2) C34 agmatinyltransferase TiaS
MNDKKSTAESTHLDLSALNDQQAPTCPACGRRMLWTGARDGWSCAVCVSGVKR